MADSTRARASLYGGPALKRQRTDSEMRGDGSRLQRFGKSIAERQEIGRKQKTDPRNAHDQRDGGTEFGMPRSSVFYFLINLFDLLFQMRDDGREGFFGRGCANHLMTNGLKRIFRSRGLPAQLFSSGQQDADLFDDNFRRAPERKLVEEPKSVFRQLMRIQRVGLAAQGVEGAFGFMRGFNGQPVSFRRQKVRKRLDIDPCGFHTEGRV